MSLFDADDYLIEPVAVDPPEAVTGGVGDAPLDVDSRDERVVEAAVALAEMSPVDPEEPSASVEDALHVLDLTVPDSIDEHHHVGSLPEGADDVAVLPDAKGSSELAPTDLFAGVRGQPDAVALLRRAAKAPVHAYLIVGPSGNGERQLARAFAALLLCADGGCGRCDVCVRCLGELHPDLVVVEREGPFISVEQAREIVRLANRSSVEGHRKVLVLIDFHLVTNAAPTLLKVIEEPPASTVFVILADYVPSELITIASRCVDVELRTLTHRDIVELLIDDGVEPAAAERAGRAGGGRLDRARLLADDAEVGARLSFWEQVPYRLDGTGAAVSVLAAEIIATLDATASGPLQVRHRAEVAELEARIETGAIRAVATVRKELGDRHKREIKRLRDDELRCGLEVIVSSYRAALQAAAVAGTAGNGATAQGSAQGSAPQGPDVTQLCAALDTIDERARQLERNPNLGLFLQALLLELPPLRTKTSGAMVGHR